MSRVYKENNCDNCGDLKPIAAKGLCRKCYQLDRRYGSFNPRPPNGKVRGECTIDDCKNPHAANGMCDMHYKRISRHGHTDKTRPEDWGDRESHPLYKYWVDTIRRTSYLLCDNWFDDFWLFVGDVKERPKNHHVRPINKYKNMGTDNFQWSEGSACTPPSKRKPNSNRKTNKVLYITRQKRILMYEDAGYRCQICGKEEAYNDPTTKGNFKKSLAIDHCHETMKIRGVLCSSCNKGLGHFKDNKESLKKAIEYLAQ